MVCGGLPGEGFALSFCSSCAADLEYERAKPACPTCASSVAPHEVHEGKCGKCRHRRLPTAVTVRVGHYDAALAQLIRAYKYHGHEFIGPVLAGWLAEIVNHAAWFDGVEAIVSVPTHWKHRLGRPFYAAEMIAAIVAERTGLPHVPILRRVRAGPHQIGLSFSDRARNVHGAFSMRRGVALHDSRLLLIDDVKTTGATINECAKVLREAGAEKVYTAVVVTAGGDSASGFALTSI